MHAKRFVVVEVCLLDPAAIDGDFASQRSAQSIHNSTLDLLNDDVGIHDVTTVHSANHTVHTDLSFIDGDLSHLRIEAAKIIDNRNTTVTPDGQRFAPTRLFRSQLHHAQPAG